MTQAAPIPPGVPPGPGVTAPFPAPPAEGASTRMGWSLAVAGLVLVLCCGGGGAALIGFFVSQVAATNEQAQTVMTAYLSALREEDYETAYGLLCDEEQERLGRERFENRERLRKRLQSFDIGEMDITYGHVRVTERYRDGTTDEVIYTLVTDQKTAELEICDRG